MDQKSVNASNRSLAASMSPINTGRGVVIISVTGKPRIPVVTHNGISNQGVATLIVMCCVLGIIIMFCCFAAPGIRDLCKKYVFRTCVIDDPEVNNVQTPEQSATPTLILLPFGRMLVVDRSMFQALQSDPGGLDFLELSRQVIRNQSVFTESTPSILDYDSTGKGLTPDSFNNSPPAYEDVYMKDLPPAYSELSLMFRTQRRFSGCASAQNIEMGGMPQEHLENDTEVIEM